MRSVQLEACALGLNEAILEEVVLLQRRAGRRGSLTWMGATDPTKSRESG